MASQFDVNIRTTGDTSGAEKVEQSLDRVEEKAAAANAGGASGGGVRDTAQLEREASLRQQILGTETEINAQETQRAALQARQNSLLQQRQAIISSEIEALSLEAAGQTEQAAALNAEIAELRAALQIQQTTNLSEAESLALARQKIAAQAEINALKAVEAAATTETAGASLLAGANIGKARNEAITFGRELASGAATGRTLSSLLGSFGPQIAIASIAVFALVKNFGKVQEVIQAISDGIQGISGKDMAAAITKADEFGIAMRKAGEESSTQLSAGIQRLQDELLILTDKYREAVLSNDDKLAASLQEQIGAKKSLLDLNRLSLDIAKGTEGIEAKKTQDIKDAQAARRQEVEVQNEGLRLAQEFRNSEETSLSDQKKHIDDIRTALEGLGIAAASPHEAYIKSIGLADAQRNEVLKLALEWQKLGGEVSKATAAQEQQRTQLQSKEQDEIKQLQAIEKEAAKPNISLQERLKLLEQELALLAKIKQSEVERAAAAAAAHPTEAARITEINQQLANRANAPDFGTPAAADRSSSLLTERASLSKATGIPEDVSKLTQALDDQSAAITKVIDAAKSGAGEVTGKVGDLDAAVSEGFKSFSDSLQPIPEKVTTAAGGVNEKITGLGATTQAGFESIGASIAAVQASLQRTIEAQAARIGALERR